MVELGRFLGNYLGGKQPERILDIRRMPGTNRFEIFWPQNGRTESCEHIFVNRTRFTVEYFGKVRSEFAIFDSNRHFVEILSSGPKNSDEPEDILRQFLEDFSKRRVELNWEPSLDDSDVQSYKIYSNDGSGSPVIDTLITTVDRNTRRFVTDDLEPGTWKFRVDPVDALGNQFTSVLTVTVIVPDFVEPPGLPVEFELLSSTVGKVSWDASPTPSPTEYNVYANSGTGFIDQDVPWATVPGTELTATGTVFEGDWVFVVRTTKTGIDPEEDDNFDRRAEVRLEGVPLAIVGSLPNPVAFFRARAAAGGEIIADVIYDPRNEGSKGKYLNFYLVPEDDEFAFDDPPTEVGTIPAHTLGTEGPFAISVSLGLFAEDTYKVTVRVESESGVEEKSDPVVFVTSDASSPDDLISLSGMLV
jgi:hypothetical protein